MAVINNVQEQTVGSLIPIQRKIHSTLANAGCSKNLYRDCYAKSNDNVGFKYSFAEVCYEDLGLNNIQKLPSVLIDIKSST